MLRTSSMSANLGSARAATRSLILVTGDLDVIDVEPGRFRDLPSDGSRVRTSMQHNVHARGGAIKGVGGQTDG